MWPGQITKLSILARVLNKNRGGAGERITVNTLIRVATALLLSRSQELEGTTEEELRRSLGLAELQASDLQSRPDQVASSRLRWFVSHGRHLGAPTADQVHVNPKLSYPEFASEIVRLGLAAFEHQAKQL